MSTYVIGDVQGCYEPLQRLLQRVEFDATRDELWFVGDLVNRGPQSVEVLRFIRGLGDRAAVVLGNHDLHLLVVAAGIRKPHRGDTLDALLQAPDRDGLLDWLRSRSLMHVGRGHAMVHAGLLPQWSIEQALGLAREVEAVLQSDRHAEFLAAMYGNEPARWDDGLKGHDRLRVIVNAMTRLRLVAADGTMEFSHKTGPTGMPDGYRPWYDHPARASRGTPVLFGHWASLGLMLRDDVLALDTGCVWGRELTAVRLEDRSLYRCGCAEIRATGPE